MAEDNSTPKSERPPFKRTWFWVTIIISFILCIAGFVMIIKSTVGLLEAAGPISIYNGIDDDDEDDDDWVFIYDDEDDEEDEDERTNYGKTYKVDKTAVAGDLSITVTSIERDYYIDRYHYLGDGMEFVKVNLVLTNLSRSSGAYYGILSFQIIDSKNAARIPADAAFSQDDVLGSDTLNPGETVAGSYIFEIPAKDNNLVLQCSDSDGNVVKFQLP